jgi:hypothetical protein
MAIDPDALSMLAGDYAKAMTSIRGRRVQRLLRREFAGADLVLLAQAASGAPAVVGVSALGAAICVTDGRGREASVLKWLHDATVVHETRFDLHKDSLPERGTNSSSLARLRALLPLRMTAESVPAHALDLLSRIARTP